MLDEGTVGVEPLEDDDLALLRGEVERRTLDIGEGKVWRGSPDGCLRVGNDTRPSGRIGCVGARCEGRQEEHGSGQVRHGRSG